MTVGELAGSLTVFCHHFCAEMAQSLLEGEQITLGAAPYRRRSCEKD
jgi:hypothetical protein